MSRTDTTRRALLQGLVLALRGNQASLFRSMRSSMHGITMWFTAAPAETVPSVPSEADLEDLIAFAEVVVAGRPLQPNERAAILERFAEHQRERDAYRLPLYSATAALLKRLGGTRFSALDVAQRSFIVARDRLAISTLQAGERVPDDVRAVRTRVVPDLISAYYGSPAGWATVGYRDFPGKCGDLARYTRAEP